MQLALGAEVRVAPLRAGVREGHLAGLGVRAGDDGLDGGTEDLFAAFGGLGGGEQLLFGVGLQPLEQSAFEFGVAGFGCRMDVIPDGQLFLGEGLVVAFDDRSLKAQFEVLVQHGVETHARDRVVVVREVFAALQRHVVLLAVEFVERLQIGKTLGRHLLRPVVGGVHALRFRGEEGGDLDVAGVHAQERGVLARAAALHRGADHHDGVGEREAGVGGCQQHRLRAAAAGARDREAGGVDFGQRQEEVDAPDGVQGLESHHALEV